MAGSPQRAQWRSSSTMRHFVVCALLVTLFIHCTAVWGAAAEDRGGTYSSELPNQLDAPARKTQNTPMTLGLSLVDEFVLIHNISATRHNFDLQRFRDADRLRCRYFLPNGSYTDYPVVHVSRQNVHCQHPPPDVRRYYIGQPVVLNILKLSPMKTTVLYTYEPVLPHPFEATSPDSLPRPAAKPHFVCACLTMWYHTEFLFEWLDYYARIHNVTKFFIYDNLSEVDDLRGASSWLSLLFNIEYVYHPLYMTQYGFIVHCGLKAMSQCEWTAIYDIDEFYYHERHSLAATLASMTPNVGAYATRMFNVRSEIIFEEMPPGGVMRNFHCAMIHYNIKSVLRAGSPDRNFYTHVHATNISKSYRTSADYSADLVHYQYLSRDQFARKMVRQTSVNADPRYIDNNKDRQKTMYELFDSVFFSNRTYRCRTTPRAYQLMLCRLSHRVVPEVNNGTQICAAMANTPVHAVAVAGIRGVVDRVVEVPRSGRGHIGILTSTGTPPTAGEPRYSRIVHIVEHPLKGIAALLAESPVVERPLGALRNAVWSDGAQKWQSTTAAAAEAVPTIMPPSVRLLTAALEWVKVHQFYELVADMTLRVEEFSDCNHLCRYTYDDQQTACQNAIASCRANGQAWSASMDRGQVVTWAQLRGLNPHLAAEIARTAKRLAYSALEILPSVNVDEPAMLSNEQWPGVNMEPAQTFLDLFGEATTETMDRFERLRSQVQRLMEKTDLPAIQNTSLPLVPTFPVEAVAVLPQRSPASNLLAGLIFRSAARRQLRIHIGRMGTYNVAKIGQLSASVVLMQPSEDRSFDNNSLRPGRLYFEHLVGDSVQVLTVWDDPVTNYLAHIAEPRQGATAADTLVQAIAEKKFSNPLATSLGLFTEDGVRQFIAAGMPGLDLVLLSARWDESLVVLRRHMRWSIIDVLDRHTAATLRKSASRMQQLIRDQAGKVGGFRGKMYPCN